MRVIRQVQPTAQTLLFVQRLLLAGVEMLPPAARAQQLQAATVPMKAAFLVRPAHKAVFSRISAERISHLHRLIAGRRLPA